MRGGLGPILIRAGAVVGGLLVVGIILRLLTAVLSPVLPTQFRQSLNAGWGTLFSIVAPAAPAIFAVLILAAVIWVIIGRRR
jgi:hypothetical protein